ncbi:MAG: hypothetical protein JST54_10055 [Deltaproteobacteria bacterium]|nr:hypothetical protein [Deltaproteobacteria bacterium]
MSERIPGWLERLSSEAKRLSADVERKVREAADSPAGQELRKAVQDLGPQVRKAVDEVAPRVKSAYGQVAPEVRKVYDQVAPEVKRAVDEVVGVTSRAANDLFGRPTPPRQSHADVHEGDAAESDVPPNVSPEAYQRPSATEPQAAPRRVEPAGEPDDDDDAAAPAAPAPKKPRATKSGSKRPRKPSGGKGRV